jgi:hypothetical protein
MQDPILVDDELKLIDGLRRLQAFGPDDLVDVVVSDDYIDTMQLMLLSVGKPFTRKWTARRAWEFHVSVLAQRKFHHYDRVMDKNGKPRERRSIVSSMGLDRSKSNSISRELNGKLAGQPGSWVQAVTFLYGRAYGHVVEPDPGLQKLAVELVRKMDEGYNVWSARGEFLTAAKANKSRITSAKEQRQVLRRSVASAASLSNVLADVAVINPGITKDEANEWLRAFTKLRTDAVRMTRLLKERISKD